MRSEASGHIGAGKSISVRGTAPKDILRELPRFAVYRVPGGTCRQVNHAETWKVGVITTVDQCGADMCDLTRACSQGILAPG